MNLSARSILLALISATIISSGCSEKEKVETPETRVVTPDKLEGRNDIYYEVDQAIPFTGLAQEMYPNGQKDSEKNYKDGVYHGVVTYWCENGQKGSEVNCKDGEPHGVRIEWDDNGKKISKVRFENGVEKR
jgi:antitoxin component YwqK of YwqJK toxin-antitoxin module|tara:strand:- start:5667 stop:6062 length:396 start_codon:yes stop_codon:yes gene_type:complete